MLNDDLLPNKIINAAFQLVEEKGWNAVTFSDISEASHIPLSDIRLHFLRKKDILIEFTKQVDTSVLRIIEQDVSGSENEDETARDRLFDVVMTRLEVMAPYKKALSRIAVDIQCGHIQHISATQLWSSNRWMLTAAKIETRGGRGAFRSAGLTALYAQVLPVWFDDEDPGMAKTMAALDKALAKGEKWLVRADKFAKTGHKVVNKVKKLFGRIKGHKKSEQQSDDGNKDMKAGAAQTEVNDDNVII